MVMMDMHVMEAAAMTEDCKSPTSTSFEFERRIGGGGGRGSGGGGGYTYGHFSSSGRNNNPFIPFPSSSSSSFKWEDAQKWLPLPDSPSPSLLDSNQICKPAIPMTPLVQLCSVHPSKQQQQQQAQARIPPIGRNSPAIDADVDGDADAAAAAINYNHNNSNIFYRSSMSSFQTSRLLSTAAADSHLRNATTGFAFPSPSPSPAPPASSNSTISDAFYFFPTHLLDDTKDVVTVSTAKPVAAAYETDDVDHQSLIILQNPKPLLDSSDWNRHPESGHLELHYGAHPFPATSIYSDGGAMSSRCKGLRSVSSTNMRDMGTEMTPIASQEPSQTPTPIPATTPTIHSPTSGTSGTSSPEREYEEPSQPSELRNMQATEGSVVSGAPPPPDQAQIKEELVMVRLKYEDRGAAAEDRCPTITEPADFGKLRLEEGADRTSLRLAGDSKALKGVDLEEVKMNVLETKAVAWEEVQQAKSMARFKRELARIQAWENRQKAKAEAEMKRIEGKMDRRRARVQEKLVKNLAATKKRAEERRAAAEGRREEEAAEAAESAQRLRRTGRLPPAWLRCVWR